MIIVLMGVSGSGKSAVGQVLAHALGWRFVDADDYHPPANVAKMHQGIPLTDADRLPWLETLRGIIDTAVAQDQHIVLACSALKHAYQHYLEAHSDGVVHYVWLTGSEELIRDRLAHRTGHFMNPGLLHSQFETLEPPEHAIAVDIAPNPETIAHTIRARLGL
jgi:gluconokinase